MNNPIKIVQSIMNCNDNEKGNCKLCPYNGTDTEEYSCYDFMEMDAAQAIVSLLNENKRLKEVSKRDNQRSTSIIEKMPSMWF